MPAGPARPPRGVPVRLARLGRLPQREVPRVPLAGLPLALRLEQLVQLLVGEAEVAGEGVDVEVDVPVGGVRVPALHQRPHHRDHLGDVAGRPGFGGRRQAAQRLVRRVERALVRVSHRPPGPIRLRRFHQDLVVDVRDVADERHLEAPVEEPATHDVEVQPGADVPDVRRALHGGATEVDRDTARGERDEVTDLPGAGVVQAKSHASRVLTPTRCPVPTGESNSRRRGRTRALGALPARGASCRRGRPPGLRPGPPPCAASAGRPPAARPRRTAG